MPKETLMLMYYGGYIGIMEKKMETIGIIGNILGYKLGLYWGCIGIMKKQLETANSGESKENQMDHDMETLV